MTDSHNVDQFSGPASRTNIDYAIVTGAMGILWSETVGTPANR
jgi:hypothetical protein